LERCAGGTKTEAHTNPWGRSTKVINLRALAATTLKHFHTNIRIDLPVVISHPKKQRVLHWLPNFHIPMGFQMFTPAGFFFTAVHHPLFFHRWKTSRTRSWRLKDKDRRLALNGLWGELPKLVPQGIKLQQQGTKLQQQGTKLQQHRLGWNKK